MEAKNIASSKFSGWGFSVQNPWPEDAVFPRPSYFRLAFGAPAGGAAAFSSIRKCLAATNSARHVGRAASRIARA